MKTSAALPLLFVVGMACTPDITQSAGPGPSVVVRFDPGATTPIVPTPNDLAKDPTTQKIVVPSSPADSPAQIEFNRNYLGLLDAFPFESVAEATTTGPLDPATVNAQNVLALDTATGASVAIAPVLVDQTISVPPPAGGWQRGHRYAIALVGGPNGLRGAGNSDVIGSETWALVSSENPLVSCADLATSCRLLVDVIPSPSTDPAARLADQLATALKLEALRRGYAPLLDALAAKGIPRANIPLLWTFTIVDAGEMTFDPASSVIPFPNDAVRTGPISPATGQATVALPHPVTGQPLTTADCAGNDPNVLLVCGLNTLDGFSTLTPLVSENAADRAAAAQATLAPASLTTATVGLVRSKSNGPAALATPPKWTPCLDCTSTPAPDGTAAAPQQLQWKLDTPLDERTTYVGYVTTDVQDDKGKNVIPNPAFALLRSTQPLVDATGKSTADRPREGGRLCPRRAIGTRHGNGVGDDGAHR